MYEDRHTGRGGEEEKKRKITCPVQGKRGRAPKLGQKEEKWNKSLKKSSHFQPVCVKGIWGWGWVCPPLSHLSISRTTCNKPCVVPSAAAASIILCILPPPLLTRWPGGMEREGKKRLLFRSLSSSLFLRFRCHLVRQSSFIIRLPSSQISSPVEFYFSCFFLFY